MARKLKRLLAAAVVIPALLAWPSLCLPGPIEGNAALSVDISKINNRVVNDAINDWEFAQIARSLLVDDKGVAKVRAAIFLFDTCYGGGMLDDLAAALEGTTLPWVAASAGSPGQITFGQDSTDEFAKKVKTAKGAPYEAQVNALLADPELARQFVSAEPLDTWTRALLPALTDPDVTVLQAIQNSFANDTFGPNASPAVEKFVTAVMHQSLQIGATASGNGGDEIKLSAPGTKSAHALLWSGLDNKARFDTSKSAMQTMLTEQWDRAGTQVITFHNLGNPGSGKAPPATRDQLSKAIGEIANQLGADEVFLFYASGHGEWGNARPVPQLVPPGRQSFLFDLQQQQLSALDIYQPTPHLDIAYSGLEADAAVWFNGQPLGDLVAGASSNLILNASFPIELGWTSLHNEVQIANAAAPFTLQALNFFPGQCCDFAVVQVEEPATTALLLIALGALMLARSAATSGEATRA